MRGSCGKILLIVGILVIVGGSLGTWALVRWDSSASRFGVTDKTKAALPVKNNTTGFYVIAVRITRRDGQFWDLGTAATGEQGVFPIKPGKRNDRGIITGGGQEVFAIEPGDYELAVTYSDHRSRAEAESAVLYVVNSALSTFAAKAGAVVSFTLAGGANSGGVYTPPDLYGP